MATSGNVSSTENLPVEEASKEKASSGSSSTTSGTVIGSDHLKYWTETSW